MKVCGLSDIIDKCLNGTQTLTKGKGESVALSIGSEKLSNLAKVPLVPDYLVWEN